MLELVKALAISMLAMCIVFCWCATVFVLKWSKWESVLKMYTVYDDGTVTDRQGFRLTSARQMLEELMHYEEGIVK